MENWKFILFNALITAVLIPLLILIGRNWIENLIKVSAERALQRSSHYYEKRSESINDLNELLVDLEEVLVGLAQMNNTKDDMEKYGKETHAIIYSGYKLFRRKIIFISNDTSEQVETVLKFSTEMYIKGSKIFRKFENRNYDPDELTEMKEDLFQDYRKIQEMVKLAQRHLASEIAK
jgi:hypothetical protein